MLKIDVPYKRLVPCLGAIATCWACFAVVVSVLMDL